MLHEVINNLSTFFLEFQITTTILGLTLFPGTTWIGVPMGFIYGGARLIGGEAFDNLFNNQFAPAPVLTPNRVKP